MVRRKIYYAIPQRPWQFAKRSFISPFYLKLVGIIAVVFYLLPVVSTKPTPSQPSPCKLTQHWVEDEDRSQLCIDCRTCPPGQGLSTECGSSQMLPFNTMVTCVPCISGVSFSRYEDSSTCIPCTSCSQGQVVEQSCSPKMDVKCTNKCSSKDRYYDVDMGDCLRCSTCCGNDADVVVDECKEKIGADSNTVCSFDSSVNRCDQTTPQPTPTNSSVSPKHDVPYTTQKSDHSTQAKDLCYLAAIVIPVVIVVVLFFCTCLCFKKKLAKMLSCCNHNIEEEDHHDLQDRSSSDRKSVDDSQVMLAESGKSNKSGKFHSGSKVLLLAEGTPENLDDSEPARKKDSKLLSSLLESASYQYLKKICERLDTAMAGVGDYRDVCSHYDIDHYEKAAVYERHKDGPSRALIDHLAATHDQLTVAEFVTVVRKVAKRGDVAKLLEEYDLL